MCAYHIRKYIWIEGYEIDTVKEGAWGLQSEDLEPQPYCSVAMAIIVNLSLTFPCKVEVTPFVPSHWDVERSKWGHGHDSALHVSCYMKYMG